MEYQYVAVLLVNNAVVQSLLAISYKLPIIVIRFHAPYKLAKSHFVRKSFPRNLFFIACYKYRVGNLSVLL